MRSRAAAGTSDTAGTQFGGESPCLAALFLCRCLGPGIAIWTAEAAEKRRKPSGMEEERLLFQPVAGPAPGSALRGPSRSRLWGALAAPSSPPPKGPLRSRSCRRQACLQGAGTYSSLMGHHRHACAALTSPISHILLEIGPPSPAPNGLPPPQPLPSLPPPEICFSCPLPSPPPSTGGESNGVTKGGRLKAGEPRKGGGGQAALRRE